MFLSYLASHSISLRQHERTHSFAVQLFQKKVFGENGNRGCTTEKNRGYAIWYHMCVHLAWKWGFLPLKTKETHAFFQLKDVSRFLVRTAYGLRLYIASHKKFKNSALNCSFRMKPPQPNVEEHGQNHINRHRRGYSLNGAGIID